ncbi:alpha-ketoglutarate-dependent dioxygenase AlkB [Hoeflea olei]|uniref:alpha-ketoglutarate-dependent dioxygenase AlkB n=1 Tax=Hoeflea olei TaxID=1480615 RepID=UPI000A7F542D|nr:alpha-ketoglutarate-dependent dioxygenase AlkB [Hoeflea olei]
MNTTSTNLPPGAICLPSFISAEEEAAFVGHLDACEWSTELKRRVQHFGYRYDYRARAVTADAYLGPLPVWLAPLAERLRETGVFCSLPDQVIANEYLPGQGISAHVDCVPCFGDAIVSVSLLSSCEMVFRERRSGAKRAVRLEPRSAVLLTEAARYNWTHEIPARKSDAVDGVRIERARRISLTFRKVIRTG